MIGNDVVDLADPETCAKQLHPRFDARILNAAEQDQLQRARDPHRLRWTLWAAKEASYKRGRKLYPNLIFSPCAFATRVQADGAIKVTHPRFASLVQIVQQAQYVHAIAHPPRTLHSASMPGTARVTAAVAQHRPEQGNSASLAVRHFARQILARQLQLDDAQLQIVTRQKIPYLTDATQHVLGDLSLSHHGRFVAVAFQARMTHDNERLQAAACHLSTRGAKPLAGRDGTQASHAILGSAQLHR